MAKDSFVVDCDVHHRSSLEDVVAYFDEPWKTRMRRDAGDGYAFPTFFPTPGGGDRFNFGRVDRRSQPEMGSTYPGPMEPGEIAAAMDFLGTDVSIVLDHLMLITGGITAEDGRIETFSRGLTRYTLDHIVDPDNGIYSALPIPTNRPEAAVELIEEYGDEEGIVGIYLVTGGPEPPLGNHRYEPMYEAAEERGLAALFHTAGSGLDEYHVAGYEKFISTHTLGFLNNNMSQATSVVIQGIPEKFPDLDIVFLEAGIFWVGLLMSRLDTEYLKRPSEAAHLTRRPSAYMREFYYGTQPLETDIEPRYIETMMEMIGGADRLLYASDFPHWDFDRPSIIRNLPFLSEEEKHNILGENAREVFGI